MPGRDTQEALVRRKLDAIVELLEDIFILHAARTGIKQQEIGKLLGVSIVRVNRMAKQIKK